MGDVRAAEVSGNPNTGTAPPVVGDPAVGEVDDIAIVEDGLIPIFQGRTIVDTDWRGTQREDAALADQAEEGDGNQCRNGLAVQRGSPVGACELVGGQASAGCRQLGQALIAF
jgi:hypothetical protein